MPGTITSSQKKSLARKVSLLGQLKAEKDDIESQIKELQDSIVEILDSVEQKSLVVELEDRSVKATKIQAVRTTIDESSLKKSLGDKIWLKVSVRVLDKKRLEAAIAHGEVDPLVVAECSTETESAPYIKLS